MAVRWLNRRACAEARPYLQSVVLCRVVIAAHGIPKLIGELLLQDTALVLFGVF